MKKTLGFTSFEFYFVMSVIGIIVLVAMQRYLQLAEETKRLSFEVVAKHFNASVYNHHARWIMAQQQTKTFRLEVDGLDIQFSPQGWALAVINNNTKISDVSLASCLSLWNNLLQNPPSISYDGGDPYGSRAYHLSVPQEGACRYELITEYPGEFYFEYAPLSGRIIFHTPPITKNN
jgi:MSHA pilin protein MshB